MTTPFESFQGLTRASAGRPLVLWGAGNIAMKTMRRVGDRIALVCDNSANMWGGRQDGIEIIDPPSLRARCEDAYIVICTTSFREVSLQLESLGYQAGSDFMISPILNDLRIINEMESLDARILFSSGMQPSNDPLGGGGVYEMVVRGDEWSYRKILSGSCHSITVRGEHVWTVDDKLGLIELDGDYTVIRNRPLPTRSRGHGLAFDDEEGHFYISCSARDAVLAYDSDLEHCRTLPLSDKHEREGGPFHHTNDCCIVGDSLYVSMFSETGNWRRDVFDGAVVEFDLRTAKKIGTPIRDLWMPHNVAFINGGIMVLDSLRGALRGNNASILGEFPAFTRGLAHNGDLFFIGQSRNRNFSRNFGLSNNISIDTGITIFDEITKVSRTLQLPSKVSEIHGIAMLP